MRLIPTPGLFYTPDVTRCLLPLLLALSGVVSAGGVEPINRNQPFHWIPGVIEVFTVSWNQLETKAFTNAITLRSGGQPIQVFVTTGIISDDPGASAVNNIQAWVQSPTGLTPKFGQFRVEARLKSRVQHGLFLLTQGTV